MLFSQKPVSCKLRHKQVGRAVVDHVFNNIRVKKIAVNDLDKAIIYSVADARSKDVFESSMLTFRANLPRAYQYLVDIQPGSEGWVQYKINDLGFATFGTKTSSASEETTRGPGCCNTSYVAFE
ncbi:hypothetical protein H257_16480 [Aphanomyces astaci]|uniref:Uncharacterized protein n=1 Tax=Aphanomyces astaci TaxID=112090 RepID=W4FI89_APHAT|nr:hypothetical protein H257_16480 [Aphanomyces astaci]ETV67227.1 hypothetical protein H257_16480 [Aphanomyces astaci]|eukprot:XP_009843215.1 hypothetical protein H257_16480 [Aphanomyces astaci]